jgi:predicted transcriptional regulator
MYSPKIDEALVRQLYQLKQVERRPMTLLANEAIQQYLNNRSFNISKEVSSDTAEQIRTADK